MEIDELEMQEIDNIFNDAYKKTTTLREAWRYAMMRYAEIYHDREVKKLNEPAVSKCDSIERRNLLIDFGNQVVEIQNRYHCILQDVEKEVDAYLKSINNC